MAKNRVTEEEKEKVLRKVQHEFPGCKSLQDIHYYRYLKQIEWKTMTPDEIVKDIKEGARQVKREMENKVRQS
jgi:hypothetical protein